MTPEQIKYIIDLLTRAEFEDEADEDRADLAIEILEGAIDEAEEDPMWIDILDREAYFEMLEEEQDIEEGLIVEANV